MLKLLETLLIILFRLGVAAGSALAIYGFLLLQKNENRAGLQYIAVGLVVLIICSIILCFTRANENVAYKREMRDFGKQVYEDAIRNGHSKSSAKMQAEQAVLVRHEQNLQYHMRGLKKIPEDFKPRKKW